MRRAPTWLRAWIRDTLGGLLHYTGVTHLGRRQRDRLAIVTFHRVLPPDQLADYPIPDIAMSPDEFRWFLTALDRHFACMPLRDAARRWEDGVGGKPPLALTFDDGQRDNLLHAAPALETVGMRATFFATTAAAESGEPLWHDRVAYAVTRLLSSASGSTGADPLTTILGTPHFPSEPGARASLPARAVERAKSWTPGARQQWLAGVEQLQGSSIPSWDGMMGPAELRSLAAVGHEVGCHSHSHAILPALSDSELDVEIVESKARLEAMTGAACTSFSYPNGDHDPRCVRLVRAHYRLGVTTQWGSNRRSADRATLRRFDMDARHIRSGLGNLAVPLLAWRMSGLYPGLTQ